MAQANQGNEKPASVQFFRFLYQEELRGRKKFVSDAEYIFEIKYHLTDELIHKNYAHTRKFCQVEVGHMQDSVIYKKRLRMRIAKLKKEREDRRQAIGIY